MYCVIDVFFWDNAIKLSNKVVTADKHDRRAGGVIMVMGPQLAS